jgi:hypothetical protein
MSKPGALTPKHLSALIHAHIVMDVTARRVPVPERMTRNAIREDYWYNTFAPEGAE